jgi:4-deoxy-L-threo-5-hexosulose-uronate ketol-isomerase
MNIKFQHHPSQVASMTTDELREHFLLENLFTTNTINLVYSHYDRMIIGGVVPTIVPIELINDEELKADYFLQRREIGIINIGGEGSIVADGQTYTLSKLDCLYLGKETQQVFFSSNDANTPAMFYLLSAPAHCKYPNSKMSKAEATPVNLGDVATSNVRTIYKYIHNDGIKSCQLVMGVTVLNNGSVWNSVPPHTHTRRMEVYLYFDVATQHRIFHFMGTPQQTKSVVIANNQAIIAAPWSVHFGCGTSNYAFVWAMAGENKAFTDMDAVAIESVK